MSSFWVDACNHAVSRPLQSQLDSIYISCSLTVRRVTRHRRFSIRRFAFAFYSSCLFGSRHVAQVAAYCVSALASGRMFFLWWRLGQARRREVTVWRLYGWFSGLMLCGSCVGAVTWGAQMPRYAFGARATAAGDLLFQRSLSMARSMQWLTVVAVTYAVETSCVSVAQLMVLDRMWDFATPTAESLSRRWVFVGRAVLALVVAGNSLSLCGSFAAAFYFNGASTHYFEAWVFYGANNTADGDKSSSEARTTAQLGYRVAAAQYFGEVSMLLLILAAFTVVGAACALRVRSTLLGVLRAGAAFARSSAPSPVFAQAAEEGKRLQLQILGSTVFLFFSFLLRSAYSTFRAVALQRQDSVSTCLIASSPCDANCYNVFSLIQTWLNRTPEFQVTVVFISAPIALLVALAGMTNKVISQREQYAAQLLRERAPTGHVQIGHSASK